MTPTIYRVTGRPDAYLDVARSGPVGGEFVTSEQVREQALRTPVVILPPDACERCRGEGVQVGTTWRLGEQLRPAARVCVHCGGKGRVTR